MQTPLGSIGVITVSTLTSSGSGKSSICPLSNVFSAQMGYDHGTPMAETDVVSTVELDATELGGGAAAGTVELDDEPVAELGGLAFASTTESGGPAAERTVERDFSSTAEQGGALHHPVGAASTAEAALHASKRETISFVSGSARLRFGSVSYSCSLSVSAWCRSQFAAKCARFAARLSLAPCVVLAHFLKVN